MKMIENYTFNENEKRFEPHEKKCTYCDTTSIEDIEDCYFIPLFITNDRTNIIVYRSVKSSKIIIGIPRCSSCKNIHYQSKVRATQISWGIAILILIGLILFFASLNVFLIVLGFFAILFTGFYGSEKLAERYVVNEGIYTLKDGAETNEVVRDLVISGWSFTQPSA